MALVLVLSSCTSKIPKSPEPLIEVQVIFVYHIGDAKLGWWGEPAKNWTTYERTDTHERKNSLIVLGKIGEKFKARWSEL